MLEHERVFLENLERDIDRVEQFFRQKETQYYESYNQSLVPLVCRERQRASVRACMPACMEVGRLCCCRACVCARARALSGTLLLFRCSARNTGRTEAW